MVRHCCLIKSLTSFCFLSNLSFLITKLEIYTMVFSFFTDKPKSTIPLALFSELSSLFRLLVPWWSVMLLGEASSKQLLRWCFIEFVVAPGMHLTETVDFVRLFNRQPSTCFTIESPGISVFFLWGIFNLRSWLIFWFPLLLILCKLIILLPSVFGDSYKLFIVDLCFSYCAFSWCRFGGNRAELILAGTQWFSVSDLMMDVLFRFSCRR